MKCSLGISNFLEGISSISYSIAFLYFFVLITEEGFLISLSLLFFGTVYSIGYIFPFLFCLSHLLFSQLFVSPPRTFAFLHFFFLDMVLITASCTVSQTSVHSSSGTLSNLIPWIYFSLPLYNHKGFDLGHIWMAYSFPYFLQFTSKFGNKEFIIWATVTSQSCFCWLYRASPSLAAKSMINLISIFTIWWCPCVESSLVL